MKRLKELRVNYKLTTRELANKLNLAQSTISLYESGKRQPDYDTLKKIALFFNVTTDFLLENNDKAFDFPKENSIRIIGRGGAVKEFFVSDERRKAIETLLGDAYIDPDALKRG